MSYGVLHSEMSPTEDKRDMNNTQENRWDMQLVT